MPEPNKVSPKPRTNAQPVWRIIENAPASTLAQALANAEKQVIEASRPWPSATQ